MYFVTQLFLMCQDGASKTRLEPLPSRYKSAGSWWDNSSRYRSSIWSPAHLWPQVHQRELIGDEIYCKEYFQNCFYAFKHIQWIVFYKTKEIIRYSHDVVRHKLLLDRAVHAQSSSCLYNRFYTCCCVLPAWIRKHVVVHYLLFSGEWWMSHMIKGMFVSKIRLCLYKTPVRF